MGNMQNSLKTFRMMMIAIRTIEKGFPRLNIKREYIVNIDQQFSAE